MSQKQNFNIPLSNPSRELARINKYYSNLTKQIKSGNYIGGVNVEVFENNLSKFFGVDYVVTLNSGTDALACSLYALGIGKGDEVILPSFTYFATAEVVINAGATPVFADVELDTYSISLEKILPLVTKNTKCIIPVHLYGNNADIENIYHFCKKNNIYLLEDCAQSFGSKTKSDKYLGTFGNVNAFSTYPSKTLGGVGDGGFITTNEKKIYEVIKKYRNHGQSGTYEHEISGINSRMDSINAFSLNAKLNIINKIKKSRFQTVKFYNKIFEIYEEINSFNSKENILYNYYTIQVPSSKRDSVQQQLSKMRISTSVYYKKPLHKQKALIKNGFKSSNLENTDVLSKKVLSLPLYPFMNNTEKSYLKKSITKVIKAHEII